MRKNILFILLLSSVFTHNCELFAQTLPSTTEDNFLQGRFLEIGIQSNGAFGAHTSPAGYHPHTAATGSGTELAEVYDIGHDGWTVGTPALTGDYTYPGDPFEGWEIQVGTGRGQAFCSGISTGTYTNTSAFGLYGHNYSYGSITGSERSEWIGGAMDSALRINMETRVDTNASWVVMTVRLHNTTDTTIHNIYYLRTCDPDNDETHSIDFDTDNSIVYQNDSAHRVLVSSKGQHLHNHFDLGTKDARAKGFIYEENPISFSANLGNVYSETAGGLGSTQYALGGELNGDYAIGLIFKIDSIAPGDSTTFSYAYIFNDTSGIDSAFISPCTGVPVTGIFNSSTPMACATTPVMLTDTGATYGASYQWQSSADSVTWSNIPGATSSVDNFTGIVATTYYRCIVSCTVDSTASAASNVVRIDYTPLCPCVMVSAGMPVAATYLACAMDSVIISDTTSATAELSLQWQSSPDSAIWTNITGATSNTFTNTGMTATTYFRLKFNCTIYSDSIISPAIKIVYNAACICYGTPAAGDATASTTYCDGCTLALGLEGSTTSDSISYQWMRSLDDITFEYIAGTSSTDTITPDGAYYYRCAVQCLTSYITSYSTPVYVGYAYHIIADSVVLDPDSLCTDPEFYIEVNGRSDLQVQTWYGDGTSDINPLESDMSTSYAYISHYYSSPGTYTIKQVILNDSAALDSVTYSYEYLYCRTLPVKLYMDLNNDCIQEATEPFNGMPVSIAIDSNGIAIDTVSATSGLYYKAYGLPGTVYSFSVIDSGMAVSCPASGIIYDTITILTDDYPVQYFGLRCADSATYDLSVTDLIPVTGTHDQWGNIYASNTSCEATDAVVTLHYSRQYNVDEGSGYLDVWPTPDAYTDSTITWNVPDLSATTSPVDLYYAIWTDPISGTLTPGDTILTYVTITPTSGDVDTTNNHVTIIDTVRASCDPNEMSVYPSACLPSTDTFTQLQYTINFVNTGNDTAHNIYVMDTLSNNIDLRSIKLVTASAAMNIAVFNDGTHNLARFDFPHINLLDSSHHSKCSGSVVFNINTTNALPDGATIFNHAGIFFDDNAVVMTDTVKNTIGCPVLNVTTLHSNALSIYPNPASTELTITNTEKIINVSITDLTGREVYTRNYNTNKVNVNIAGIAAGIYFVKVNNNAVRKFVKE